MLIDKNLMFHDDTAITTAAEYKGSSLPLHEVGNMLREGKGEPLEVLVQITEDFAGGTSMEVQTITANDAALTTEIEQMDVVSIPLTATLLAGRKFRFPLAMVLADADASHFGVQFTSVGTHTTGKVSAWIQRAGEDQNSY